MSNMFHSYEPRHGHRLPHDPFNMIVAPRPIGRISTRSASGGLNLAPYSFFNAFNYNPPIVGFSSIGYKDSVRNVEQTVPMPANCAAYVGERRKDTYLSPVRAVNRTGQVNIGIRDAYGGRDDLLALSPRPFFCRSR